GIFAAGGSYTINNVEISMDGDGRSDFAGYGAAVMATGTDTTLVLDNVDIDTHGVVRTGVIADNGSNVIVKNSSINTKKGTLPSDYVQTVNPAYMRSVPWMLGINGSDNVRATNLLGTDSKATYINSTITSDGWGVLSTDSGSNCTLTAINSTISTSGNDGYGTFAIGNPHEYFYGCVFNVGSYATINSGGYIYYDDSSAANVAALNTSVSLGLTAQELEAIPQQSTIINSDRFGVMWRSSSGTVNVAGGTELNTNEATFLVKTSEAITITIDGSDGAKINPKNGIILQVMDDDDPGPVMTDMSNTNTYTDPYFGTTDTPTADTSFDLTSTTDAAAPQNRIWWLHSITLISPA
ncbi:MAG: putative secreted protein, partial [Firmicutes bacterium]|nr:putative secreted protein [Bacillota bacterium]